MKRVTHKTGIRKYFGNDLAELQTEPLIAIDAMLSAAGNCVISGCAITATGDKYDIAPGYVALIAADQDKGSSRIMAMPFEGITGVTLPIYLTSSVSVVERAYEDGAIKPIAYNYRAVAVAIKPTDAASIEITPTYTRRLSDALAEALTKYVVVTDAEKSTWNGKASTAVATTSANGLMAAADKTKLNGIAAGANNYVHPADANTRHVTDAEKSTWNGKASTAVATTSANGLMAAADKTKLNGIAAGANNYVHPAEANTRHVTDAEKSTWNGKASTAVATSSANGLMAAADKTKLNGIAAGANNYVHPADANTRHVTDAEKSTWNGKANASHNHSVATSAADGFMTKADKSKLDGIAAGANNYVHPADANTRHVTDTEKSTWNGKANASHNHSIANVTDLQTKLDGKANAGQYNSVRSNRKNSVSSYDAAELSPSGLLLMRGRTAGTSMAPISITFDGIQLPPNSTFSMPGVLRAGTVNSDGTRANAWGSTKATVKRTSQGRYRITHAIGHTNYFFNGTLIGSFTGAVTIINRQTSYIDVEVRGLDANLHDVAFDYIICGAN